MSKFEILIKSPTFWLIMATFALNGLQAIAPMLNGNLQAAVSVILLVLATYTHAGTVQKAGSVSN